MGHVRCDGRLVLACCWSTFPLHENEGKGTVLGDAEGDEHVRREALQETEGRACGDP